MKMIGAGLVVLAAATLTAVLPDPASADTWFRRGGRTVRGSGDIVEEKREVEDFNQINLDCSIDIHVKIGEPRSLTVIGDDNLLEYVVTEVAERGTLFVDLDRSISTRRGIHLEITIPNLETLEIDGSGDVDIEGLHSERFRVDIDGSGDVDVRGTAKNVEIIIDGSGDVTFDELDAEFIEIDSDGSGDIKLSGKAQRVEFNTHGSGDVNARRLTTIDAYVQTSGSGDVAVYASEKFEGRTQGSGDIDVFGDPKDFDRTEHGSGDIRRR